jgi:hypothetical protein
VEESEERGGPKGVRPLHPIPEEVEEEAEDALISGEAMMCKVNRAFMRKVRSLWSNVPRILTSIRGAEHAKAS